MSKIRGGLGREVHACHGRAARATLVANWQVPVRRVVRVNYWPFSADTDAKQWGAQQPRAATAETAASRKSGVVICGGGPAVSKFATQKTQKIETSSTDSRMQAHNTKKEGSKRSHHQFSSFVASQGLAAALLLAR